MSDHVLVGFGFGPIQSGLFVREAFRSGHFSRIVIAEVDQKLVDAIRKANGTYALNIATHTAINTEKITGIEIYNPMVDSDRKQLVDALCCATEIVTSLPSVKFYDRPGDASVAGLIAQGLNNSRADGTIIYCAENNNHAAETLQKCIAQKTPIDLNSVQWLNTVIGKMSQVVTDLNEINNANLAPMAEGFSRAFLVEEFNHILVTRTALKDFRPGIEVFVEKDDLLPFEEAKLYGHNAIHALLAYIGRLKGYAKMSDLKADGRVMQVGRDAFLKESGAALIKKYQSLGDELFTEAGYRYFAEDLLERMTNPWLADAIERAGRDVVRKLGYQDRLFGTIRLADEFGIEPVNMAVGAAAAIRVLLLDADQYEVPNDLRFSNTVRLKTEQIEAILKWLWPDNPPQFMALIAEAQDRLNAILK